MLLLLILLSAAVDNINCIGIKVGPVTQSGSWTTKHEISFPLTVGGKAYFFGSHGHGNYWFIQELRRNGTIGAETSHGTFENVCTEVFPFNINGTQFIFCLDNGLLWVIQEILPGGKMGQETDRGYLESSPTIVFPLNIHGNYYVFSLTGLDWLIAKLTSDGRLIRVVTDHGSWNKYYTLGFPFSINGRQYIYCLSDNRWFIQEIRGDGKMMRHESDGGHWTSKHILYFQFNILGKQYFYGLTASKTRWFIRELLPGGKMGPERTHGTWQNYYPVMFPFEIDGAQYLYGVSGYNWFIQKLLQVPAFGPLLSDTHQYCNKDSNTRFKRQLDNGTCPAGLRGLNFVEEYVIDITQDNNYITVFESSAATPIRSYSVCTYPAIGPNNNSIELTVAIEAEIHQRHLSHVRQPISAAVHNHLRNLDRYSDDEAGHLLADSLGGSVLPYNFVPQSPMINRMVSVAGSVLPQQGWYEVEALIRNFIRATSGYVLWNLGVIYGNLQNSRRPTDFLLSVRLYDANAALTCWQGTSAVTAFHFRNVPTVACSNTNHPWWNLHY